MKEKNPFIEMIDKLAGMIQNMDEEERQTFAELMSGKQSMESMMNDSFYHYVHPDYKPFIDDKVADWLLPLWQLSEEYEENVGKVLKKVEKAGHKIGDEQKVKDIRSFLFRLLDGFSPNENYNEWKLYALLWFIERIKPADFVYPVLEILRQDAFFYKMFITDLEEIMAAAVYQTCNDQLVKLEAFLYEDGILPDSKPIVMAALIWTALRQPQKRLKVVSIITKYLDYCLDICQKGAAVVNIERYAIALSTAHIQETLPQLKQLFEQLDFIPMELHGGFKEVERMMNDKKIPYVCCFDSIDGYLNGEVFDKKYHLVPHNYTGELPFLFDKHDMDDVDELWGNDYFYDSDVYATGEACKRYVIRVELMDAPEPVERKLQVPSNMFLSFFCDLLMTAFGRKDTPDAYEFIGYDDNVYSPNVDDFFHADEGNTDDYIVGDLFKKKGQEAYFNILKGNEPHWLHSIVLETAGRYTSVPQHYCELIDGRGAYPLKSVTDMTAHAKRLKEGKVRQPDFKKIRRAIESLDFVFEQPD